jgi:hypothetical protein
MTIGALKAQLGAEARVLHGVLRGLIEEDEFGLLYSDVHLNPYIIRSGFEPNERQIASGGPGYCRATFDAVSKPG